jgi:DNA-binding GntR family transcriptional regulator
MTPPRLMMKKLPMAPPTLSQKIIQAISEDIVSGKLLPGCKLDEMTLAERFNVSRTPIRDALRELAATRLVQYVPRSGFSVAAIDAAMLDELFEAASEIEALCAGLCALRARTLDRTRIDQLHRDGKKVAHANSQAYAELNEQLHSAIYAACGSKTIEGVAIEIRQRLAPFRSRQFYSNDRRKTSVAEHDEIVAAILAFDRPRAENAMRRHISAASVNVIRYFQRQG